MRSLGDASGEKAEARERSDQVLLLLEGELIGEVGDQRSRLQRGDVIVINAGTKHRFSNASDRMSAGRTGGTPMFRHVRSTTIGADSHGSRSRSRNIDF